MNTRMAATFGERSMERNLDLRTVGKELNAAGILGDKDRSRMSELSAGSVHPLVFLAEQKLSNGVT